ncbi:MAG: universal stress protein UspE [Aliiglaciecola sp.]
MKKDSYAFSHILVVLNYNEDATVPLARATRLCKAFDAKMTVFVSSYKIINGSSFDDIEDDLTQFVNQRQDIINQQLAKWEASDFLNRIIISWQQKPSKAVSQLIANTDFDLVLKAPYQQSEFKHLFRSGLDKYFVSECPLPVWLVKPRLWDDSFEVLACVDMGDDDHDNRMLNKKILAESDCLSQALQAQMHVVDCFYGEIGTMRIDYNSKRGFKREASIQQQHVEKLKLYINEYALSEDVLHFVEGMPDHALPDKAADINAEVAVIGNNEDTNVMDRIFGDTAVELAKAMPCDLLVIKPNIPE